MESKINNKQKLMTYKSSEIEKNEIHGKKVESPNQILDDNFKNEFNLDR
jgi:hypothetical protein